MVGAIAMNQETKFLLVYGANPPYSIPPEIFWKTTVADYLQRLQPQAHKDIEKSGKKI